MGVYKRKGKWEVRLQMNGLKYYRQVPEAQNKAQALIAEATLRKEIYEGRYGKEGREIGATLFQEFCEHVYLPDIRARLKKWKNEEYKARTLCRYFHGKRFKDITPMTVQAYKRARLTGDCQYKRPRRASSVRGEIMTLSAIINMAIDNDVAATNPCRKIRWARGETVSRRQRVLSEAEEARLMPLLEHHPATHAAVVIALNTGMRRMEILHLTISQIDFGAGLARFTGKGGRERVAPLNAAALAVMSRLAANAAPGGFLFHNRRGHNLSATEGVFQPAVRAAGITDLHFHDLRHTFSTRVRQYTDAFTVRDLMGHTRADTTDIYVNVPMSDMHAAVDALGERSKVLPFEKAG